MVHHVHLPQSSTLSATSIRLDGIPRERSVGVRQPVVLFVSLFVLFDILCVPMHLECILGNTLRHTYFIVGPTPVYQPSFALLSPYFKRCFYTRSVTGNPL